VWFASDWHEEPLYLFFNAEEADFIEAACERPDDFKATKYGTVRYKPAYQLHR